MVNYAIHLGTSWDNVTSLLTQPSAFDHADWTKVNVTIDDNSATDPDSTTLADSVIENTANDFHMVHQTIAKDTSSKTYSLSVYAKVPASNGKARLQLQLDDGGSNGRFATVDLANGEELGVAPGGYGSTFSGGTVSVVTAGNDWWLCTLAGVTTGSEATLRALLLLDNSTGTNGGVASYLGDGAGHLYFYDAVLVED